MNARGSLICISQWSNSGLTLQIDKGKYKLRHLIENFFATLKELKRIDLRCDKTNSSFAATIFACAALINSR